MMTLTRNIRRSVEEGRFEEYRDEFLGRYYAGRAPELRGR